MKKLLLISAFSFQLLSFSASAAVNSIFVLSTTNGTLLAPTNLFGANIGKLTNALNAAGYSAGGGGSANQFVPTNQPTGFLITNSSGVVIYGTNDALRAAQLAAAGVVTQADMNTNIIYVSDSQDTNTALTDLTGIGGAYVWSNDTSANGVAGWQMSPVQGSLGSVGGVTMTLFNKSGNAYWITNAAYNLAYISTGGIRGIYLPDANTASVISPYSMLGATFSMNYCQTSQVAMATVFPNLPTRNSLPVPYRGYNIYFNGGASAPVTQKDATNCLNNVLAIGLFPSFNIFTIDDTWQGPGRTNGFHIYEDPTQFPLGMKFISNLVHTNGMKFGLHVTTGGGVTGGGSAGPNISNPTYFDNIYVCTNWNIDLLEDDNIGGYRLDFASQQRDLDAQFIFACRMGAMFNGKPIIPEWATDSTPFGHYWLNEFDAVLPIAGSPSSMFDPFVSAFKEGRYTFDHTFVGNGHFNTIEIYSEPTNQLAWKMALCATVPMNSRLMTTNLNAAQLLILTNSSIYAMQEDSQASAGSIVATNSTGNGFAILRPISNSRWGLSFINCSPSNQTVTVNWNSFQLGTNVPLSFYDCIYKTNYTGTISMTQTVSSNNASVFFVSLANSGLFLSSTNATAPSNTNTAAAWGNVTLPNGSVMKFPLYQ